MEQEKKGLTLQVNHHSKEIEGTLRDWYSFEIEFVIDDDPYTITLVAKDKVSKDLLINQARKRGVIVEAND